jgi:hypothetical protein
MILDVGFWMGVVLGIECECEGESETESVKVLRVGAGFG